MELNSKIFVAGHKGLVGSAILRRLTSEGYTNIITASRSKLDLINQHDTLKYFETNKPEYVFLSAAKVGGIHANNSYPAQFIYQNVMIESNIIHSAYLSGVKKLLFLGSSCIYPKFADQPIEESSLLTGELEPTNEPYAIAKILGIKMCQSYNREYNANYISAMPTNLYGINDNFDLNNSHVLPALIRKFHEAKQNNESSISLWGTGKPFREFLFVDDLADACVYLMNNYNDPEIVNVGTGSDISIGDLAGIIKTIVGYRGNIQWDTSKPDGTFKKLLNTEKLIKLGWKYRTSLEDGIKITYDWYKRSLESGN
ncbi:MAG: GDP-L-fucose synthase [Ignavibacteria bacterium]|nr:GDP-L-fucose synthase [Ignavibacteria bacterium]